MFNDYKGPDVGGSRRKSKMICILKPYRFQRKINEKKFFMWKLNFGPTTGRTDERTHGRIDGVMH